MPRVIHPIEAESYRILRSRIDLSHLPPLSRAVAERVTRGRRPVVRREPDPRRGGAGQGREALRRRAGLWTRAWPRAGITIRTPIVPLDDPRAKDARARPHPLGDRDATRDHEAPAGAIWVIGNGAHGAVRAARAPPRRPGADHRPARRLRRRQRGEGGARAVRPPVRDQPAASAAARPWPSKPSTRSSTSKHEPDPRPRWPPQRQELVCGVAYSAAALGLATAAAPTDDEMRDRIDVHQARRGPEWRTLNVEDDPARALTEAHRPGPARRPRRLDRGRDAPPRRVRPQRLGRSTRSCSAGVAALQEHDEPVVVVAEEAGLGPVPIGSHHPPALARPAGRRQPGPGQRPPTASSSRRRPTLDLPEQDLKGIEHNLSGSDPLRTFE